MVELGQKLPGHGIAVVGFEGRTTEKVKETLGKVRGRNSQIVSKTINGEEKDSLRDLTNGHHSRPLQTS